MHGSDSDETLDARACRQCGVVRVLSALHDQRRCVQVYGAWRLFPRIAANACDALDDALLAFCLSPAHACYVLCSTSAGRGTPLLKRDLEGSRLTSDARSWER